MRVGDNPERSSIGLPARQAGFSMIELMVTLAVLAILIAMAVPSFTSIINNNRLAAQANEVITSLQVARTEAIRRNERVTVCRSTDGATCSAASRVGITNSLLLARLCSIQAWPRWLHATCQLARKGCVGPNSTASRRLPW